MDNVRVGDTVEATLRGTVSHADANGIALGSPDDRLQRGLYLNNGSPWFELSDVKVLKKALPRVGEEITSREQLEALPAQSVIASRQWSYIKNSEGKFVGADVPSATSLNAFSLNSTYVIKFIPEA